MSGLFTAWHVVVVVAAAIASLAVFIQTVLSILKSRYELRKLRAEDEKVFARSRGEKGRTAQVARMYGRSDYYYERLDTDLLGLIRGIVVTVFVAVAGLFYVYITVNVFKNDVVVRGKREQLSVLQQANGSLGDALAVLHAVKDRERRGKQKSSP